MDQASTDVAVSAYAPSTVQSAYFATPRAPLIRRSQAYTVGYSVGSGFYYISDVIDPNINLWLSDEIGSAVTDIVDTVYEPFNSFTDDSGSFWDWLNWLFNWD